VLERQAFNLGVSLECCVRKRGHNNVQHLPFLLEVYVVYLLTDDFPLDNLSQKVFGEQLLLERVPMR
jgi:hypothetical protein